MPRPSRNSQRTSSVRSVFSTKSNSKHEDENSDDELVDKRTTIMDFIMRESHVAMQQVTKNEIDSANDIDNIERIKKSQPWVEKYRPRNFNDIVGNAEIVSRFKIMAQEGDIQHMILAGSPGTGKTTCVLCLAKHLLGPKFHEAFVELNASNERGINVIREKIVNICKKRSDLPEGRQKIIFLDEVDSMTQDAQQALRRIIEKYTPSTRFVMACNSLASVTEAIQSRCSVFRFSRIANESMIIRLKQICKNEKIEYRERGLTEILNVSNGDLRTAINNLQTIAIGNNSVTIESVTRVLNQPEDKLIKRLIERIIAHSFQDAYDVAIGLLGQGYSANDIVRSLFRSIRGDDKLSEIVKIYFCQELGHTDYALVQGGDGYLQIMALIARLVQFDFSKFSYVVPNDIPPRTEVRRSDELLRLSDEIEIEGE